MDKCLKCNTELVYIEEENVYFCPKCGEKYKNTSSDSQNITDTPEEPQSLYEQFKAKVKNNNSAENDESQNLARIMFKNLIKPKVFIYLIAITLLITCLAVCATPISYNTRFTNKENTDYYNKTYAIVFRRNNICETQYDFKTTSVRLYFIENDTINLSSTDSFEIINRTTIQSRGGTIYKAENGGEIFLIVITVLWCLFAIIFAYFSNKKRQAKTENLNNSNKN